MVIAATTLLAWSAPQSAPPDKPMNEGVYSSHLFFRRFTSPVYPPLARMANVFGDVVLKITFRPDGSFDSLSAVSGNPILTQAALDSARQSQFECRVCGASELSQSLTYSFLIFPAKADPCCCTSRPGVPATTPTTQVSQLQNHITIIEPPICVCPDACSEAWAQAHAKYRSAKCLYLWRCGKRQIGAPMILGGSAKLPRPLRL